MLTTLTVLDLSNTQFNTAAMKTLTEVEGLKLTSLTLTNCPQIDDRAISKPIQQYQILRYIY